MSDDSVSNRVIVTRPIAVQSVNGAVATVIDGAAAERCVYLAAGSSLAGFTLTNGNSTGDGGGIFCESGAVVSNCVVTGNYAANNGGGASGGVIFNCAFFGNSAAGSGGGVENATIAGSTLIANSAYNGAGADSSTLNGCTCQRQYRLGCFQQLWRWFEQLRGSSSVSSTATAPGMVAGPAVPP